MSRDYSQVGDPYGIAAQYTSQSAVGASAPGRDRSGNFDLRGNTIVRPRGVPTQEEADAMEEE